MNDVNLVLQALTDEARLEQVQAQYDEMMEVLSMEYWMVEQAAHSYDEDCIAYGEM